MANVGDASTIGYKKLIEGIISRSVADNIVDAMTEWDTSAGEFHDCIGTVEGYNKCECGKTGLTQCFRYPNRANPSEFLTIGSSCVRSIERYDDSLYELLTEAHKCIKCSAKMSNLTHNVCSKCTGDCPCGKPMSGRAKHCPSCRQCMVDGCERKVKEIKVGTRQQCQKCARLNPMMDCAMCHTIVKCTSNTEQVCDDCLQSDVRTANCIGCGVCRSMSALSVDYPTFARFVETSMCDDCTAPFPYGRDSGRPTYQVVVAPNYSTAAWYLKYDPKYPRMSDHKWHVLRIVRYQLEIATSDITAKKLQAIVDSATVH